VEMQSMGRTMRVAWVLATLGVAGGAAGEAPESKRFGDRGQLVLNGDLAITAGHRWGEGNGSLNDFTFFSVRPSVDYFVLEGLSLGVTLGLGGSFGENSDFTEVGAGLRVGYALPLGERVSLWPRLGASLYHQNIQSQFGGREQEDSASIGRVDLFTPLLVHPTSSFFIGLGPVLAVETGDFESVSLGVQSLVGGYF